MEALKKYKWLILIISALILINGIWGYSYRKITKERDILQNRIGSMTTDSHGVTIYRPVEVAGKPMTEIIYLHDTHTQSVTQTQSIEHTKTVTVEKKGMAWVGLGANLCNPQQWKAEIGYQILGPIGVEIEPFAELPAFRNPGVFLSLTYRP